MLTKEKHRKLLLVEGSDDQHVVWTLCKKFEVAENFDVIDCGGIDGLVEQLPLRFKQADKTVIGIVIDADINLDVRWNEIRTILLGQGYGVPQNLPKSGLIYSQDGKASVGVWIMPNNDVPGMLEDFAAFLVPSSDQLMPEASQVLQKIENEAKHKYKEIHRSKALIHTWLAWQEDPGTPIGLAITKKYLSTDKDACKALVTWLHDLFS